MSGLERIRRDEIREYSSQWYGGAVGNGCT